VSPHCSSRKATRREEVEDILYDTARDGGDDFRLGGGIVDAAAAVKEAAPTQHVDKDYAGKGGYYGSGDDSDHSDDTSSSSWWALAGSGAAAAAFAPLVALRRRNRRTSNG
jgi:hypothetical protein